MALTLSRKVGERIWIGENITVDVGALKGGGVRLTIDAPKDLKILRDEVRRRTRIAAAAWAELEKEDEECGKTIVDE